jgi:hypothetical protein
MATGDRLSRLWAAYFYATAGHHHHDSFEAERGLYDQLSASKFSVIRWACQVIACRVIGNHFDESLVLDEGKEGYYALATDLKTGRHCPYPLLPRWAKALFRWAVAFSKTAGHGTYWQVRSNKTFYCRECGTEAFYAHSHQYDCPFYRQEERDD